MERTSPWYDQQALYCALSGRLIPGRAWVADIDGQRLIFCDPESAQLYRDHVRGDSPAAPREPAR